jgi:hypothetical protein
VASTIKKAVNKPRLRTARDMFESFVSSYPDLLVSVAGARAAMS